MSLREFLVLLGVCTLWGLHFTVMRTAIDGHGIPPLFYAATRMSLVALLMAPFLRWHAGRMGWVVLAGLGFGAFNYLFMFPALGMTTASAASVAIELYMPITVLLGVVLLGERVRGWSSLGIALAFVGVVVIALSDPGEAAGPLFAAGIGLMVLAACSEATGALAVKRLPGLSPFQLVAWAGVMGSLVLWPATLLLEDGQARAFAPELRATFIAALLYSAVLVSVVAHGSYYWLLGRLPLSVVTPVGLLTTVIGVAGGLLILGERLTPALALGVLTTLGGVGIVIWRSAAKRQQSSRTRRNPDTEAGHDVSHGATTPDPVPPA